MNWRQFRRRLTPGWLRIEARRRRRDILLRGLGLARSHAPPIVTRRPELVVRSWLPYVVAELLLRNNNPTFLQIGAFDGVGDDDLRDLVKTHRLRGVLVEPQPAAFARLQETYADQPQVLLLAAAIAEQEGTRPLYVRRGKTSMAASFDRGHLRRHGIAAQDIGVIQVPCHTVASALCTAGLETVDILQIDAEGYDWPIIRSIDFERVRPAILRFEYRNLRPRDADACLARLSDHGYRFLLEPRDIIAVRPALESRLQPALAGQQQAA
jgi:FkbM family methyltransferase